MAVNASTMGSLGKWYGAFGGEEVVAGKMKVLLKCGRFDVG